MDGSFAADKRRARPRFFFSQAERAARARLGHVWGQKIIIKKGGLRYELAAKPPPLAPPAGAALPGGGGRGAPGCPTGRGCSHRRRGREAPGGLGWVPGDSESPGRHPRARAGGPGGNPGGAGQGWAALRGWRGGRQGMGRRKDEGWGGGRSGMERRKAGG